MVLVACYTLFLSKERSRWWGITFLGNVGMGREREGTGGEDISRFGGVWYAFVCEWEIILVGEDMSGSWRHNVDV